MIVYTCPKCGAELRSICICTYPASYYEECFQCGWKSPERKEEIVSVSYPETVDAVYITKGETC